MCCSLNPYADFAYDGLLLNPMEVVFVKVKRFQQEANWGSARLANAYSRWMEQEVRAELLLQCCAHRLEYRLKQLWACCHTLLSWEADEAHGTACVALMSAFFC